MDNRPKVGVGVIVLKEGKVLIGKRKSSHGEGSWSFPGGHLEFNEEIEECAKREVMEETGICVKNIRKTAYTNDIFEKEKKHYVTLFVVCEYESGNVEIKEPDKCENWMWFDTDKLPKPLFLPIQNLMKQNNNHL